MGQELTIGATISEMLSGLFISAVKLFINPIIFLTITLGIVSMGDLKKVGKVGAKALLYFEVVTTVALIIGIVVANVIRPGDGVMTEQLKGGDISKYPKGATEFSWLKFFLDNVTLQVLVFAILLGIVLSRYSGREQVVALMTRLSKYIFWGLHKVMLLAPIGAFGGMAFTIGKYGLGTLLPLAKLMGTVYTTMAVFIFGGLGLVMRSYNISLWGFLKYIREEPADCAGYVFFGSSATLAHGETRTHGLRQIGGRAGGTGRLFIQPRRHNHLPVDGHDFSGAGLQCTSGYQSVADHHRHSDGNVERSRRGNRQRFCGTGQYADSH